MLILILSNRPAIDEVEEEDDEGEGEEPLELCGNCATETSTIICLGNR